MTWTADFIAAVAQRMDDNSIGTWDPDGTTGDIYEGALPSDVDTGIGLTPYNLRALRTSLEADVVQPVQFWLRGTSSYVRDTADSIYSAFQGLQRVTFGGAFCVLVSLHSDVPMGVDQSGRFERALNYDFQATRVTAQTLT
jgi:hypothetical protein